MAILNHFKTKECIIYEANIVDIAFHRPYKLYFRYKSLHELDRRLRQAMKREDAWERCELAEFPKGKSSFGLWNRTNKDTKLIDIRKRELEFYMNKLLNNQTLQHFEQLRYIRSKLRCADGTRAKSEDKTRSSAYELTYC